MVAPLILGLAALLGIANMRMEDDKGVDHNLLREAFDSRSRRLLDQFHVASRRTPPRADIIVLGIDDASQTLDEAWPEDIEASPALQAMKQPFPWPRRVWAYLLDRVFSAGAKMVFLDLVFKAPSPDPEDDRLLQEALEKYKGKVILGAKFEENEIVGNALHTGLTTPNKSVTGKIMPDDGDFGLLSFWPDEDEIVRHVNFRIRASEVEGGAASDTEKLLPAVCLVAAGKLDPGAAATTPDTERIRFSWHNVLQSDGTLKSAYPPLSLFQIFVKSMWESNFQSNGTFKDKVVFVGATATDMQDFQQTAVGRMAGVQLHAHALTALMAKSFVYDAPGWWRFAGLVLGALCAWALVTFVRQPLLCLASLALLATAVFYGSYLLFDIRSIEFSPLPSIVTLGFCGVAGLTGNFVVQRRDSKKLQRFLARYTSPEQAQQMMSDRAGLYTTLQGVERTVTMFFSDVRGFTSMSENMTPTEVVTQLNEYLSRMVERVITHRGIVDKFIGDAVMAEWGATRAQQSEEACRQDALNAVTAALAMRTALEELNAGWRDRGIAELHIGMGIHQGDVVVGNIGSEAPYEKMDLTVIGDAVNLASRLESATKQYGVDLIISEAVQRHVKEAFVTRSADFVTVKGKAKPVEVFTVIGPADSGPPKGLETFEQGIRLYRDPACRFTEAGAAFTQAAAEGLDDELTHEYQKRCRDLAANPPEKWDGVYVMTKK